MFYYNNKRLLSEGMSLEQIKQGKNPELLAMFKDFGNRIFDIYEPLSVQLSPKIGVFTSNLSHYFQLKIQQIQQENPLIKLSEIEDMEDAESNRAIDAYTEYILVNVLEYNQDYTDTLDVNNPTNGLKGKFTEFILRILSSDIMKNSRQAIKVQFELVKNFVGICKSSSSKIYHSKNMFFDDIIIPLMNDRVSNGEKLGSINPKTGIRGANYSRPSSVSPLQDKIMKVFDAYGKYNGKNLLETIMEEVIPEKLEVFKTFAGYDEKLINYCLSQGYWQEIQAPGQPSTTRLFFIGNGDLSSLPQSSNSSKIDEEKILQQWKGLSESSQWEWGNFESFRDFLLSSSPDAYIRNPLKKSFSYYHILRGLIYACNICPFKTAYNIAKGQANISSEDVAFFKSLSNDDYIIPAHNEDYKIRKTTDWCTKDASQTEKYVMPKSKDKVEGFILCLNDALPFDDPNGALQIGIKLSKDNNSDSGYYHNTRLTLNADDNQVSCPGFLQECFSNYEKHFFSKFSQTFLINVLEQGKRQYENIKNLNFPENADLSEEEKKRYFETMKQSKLSENLLRIYIRQLLK